MGVKIETDIYEYLKGTPKSESEALEHFNMDIDEDDLTEELAYMNLEMCPSCGYWVDSYELVDESGDLKNCDNCDAYV